MQQLLQLEVSLDLRPHVCHPQEAEQVLLEHFELEVLLVSFVVADGDAVREMHSEAHCFVIDYHYILNVAPFQEQFEVLDLVASARMHRAVLSRDNKVEELFVQLDLSHNFFGIPIEPCREHNELVIWFQLPEHLNEIRSE